MMTASATALVGALLFLAPLAMLVPGAASEPHRSSTSDDTNVLIWDFDDPTNYTTMGSEVTDGHGVLRSFEGGVAENTQASFEQGVRKENISTSDVPDSIVVNRTALPVQMLVLQPGPEGVDSCMEEENSYTNYGNDITIMIDAEQSKNIRPLMQFDVSAIPSDAVIHDATLWLNLVGGKNANVNFRVHALADSFDEQWVSWNNRTFSTPWTTPGGNYEDLSYYYGTFTQTLGWQGLDLSRLVDLWVRGALPNNGFIIMPVPQMGDAVKMFTSSDETISPSTRPKLAINYSIPNTRGIYESMALDAGTNSTFTTANWSADFVSFATDEFSGTSLSSKWTWLNNPEDGRGSYDVGLTRPDWLHVESDSQTNLTSTEISANSLYQNISGDFVATTSLETFFTTSSMGAGLLVADDTISWMAVYLTDAGTANYVVVKIGESRSASVVMMLAWDSDNVFLRISHTQDTVHAYYSVNGTSWDLAYSYTPPRPFMQRVMVGLCAFSGDTNDLTMAEFDFFRIDPVGSSPAVDVRSRTGASTDLGDLSWGAWGPVLAQGAEVGEAGRYLQYQVDMLSPFEWYSPAFTDFSCEYTYYSSIGQIETMEYTVYDFSRWYTITTYEQENGGSVLYSWSTNGGLSWSPYVSSGSYSMSSTEPSITIRMLLTTYDTASSPSIDSIEVTYGAALVSLFVLTPSSVSAGDFFPVTIYAKDETNRTMTMWTGPIVLHATDSTGDANASSELAVTEAFITTGGYVTVSDERYTVAETIRILAVSNDISGLSAPVTIVPKSAKSIAIEPELDRVLEFETYEFTATASDEYGNPVPGTDYAWSADSSLGTLSVSENIVTLHAGAGGGEGFLTVTSGELSASLLITVIENSLPPVFLDEIPVQEKPEDFGSWYIDLTPYVSDPEDSHDQLRWYVTNETIVSMGHWENVTGHMDLTFTTVHNAFGVNVLNLVVVDSTGLSTSTQVTVIINSVNDKPTIDYITPIVVRYGTDYVYNFRYYIHDVDNPYEDLRLSVDDASEPYAILNWLWITFNYPASLSGTVQFVIVKVSDGWLDSSTVVQIKVSDELAPELNTGMNLPDLVMDQGEELISYFDLDDYFSDPDGDLLIYTSGNEQVDIVINLNHTVDFCAPIDWHGEEEVVFIATDPGGARVEEAMTVTVLPLNQPPSIAPLPDLAVHFNLRYEFDLTPYLSDPDDPKESLQVTTDDSRIAVLGGFLSLFYSESVNGSEVSVRVTVSDGDLTDEWTINVTISDNYPPTAAILPDHEFLEDAPLPYPSTGWLDAYFTDAEDPEDLSFEVMLCGSNLEAIASEGWEGFWSILFTPDQDYHGISCLTIRATDSEGAIVERTVSLTVLPVPDRPQLSLPENIQVNLGTQVAYDLSLNLTDPDPEDEDFEFEVTSEVPGLTFEVHGSVLVLDFPEWFLAGGKHSRSVELTVKVRDSYGLSDTETMVVTVFRPALAEAENTWLWAAVLISGGAAFGLFIIAFGMRKRPFVIRDMMLVHNDGFLMARYATEEKGEIDEQITSGMLTAVLDFVEDSMESAHEELKTFQFQKFSTMVKRSKKVYAAVVFEGDAPDGIDEEIDSFLEKIERVYRKSIARWSGDLDTDFAGVGLLIQAFVKEHSKGTNGERMHFLKTKPSKPKSADSTAK